MLHLDMVEITVTRWTRSSTIVEVKSLGVPVYVREYDTDIESNPQIGVELVNFIERNDIDLSSPLILYHYKDGNKSKGQKIDLRLVQKVSNRYLKSQGH